MSAHISPSSRSRASASDNAILAASLIGGFDGERDIRRAWIRGLTPDPQLTVSEWADRHRWLSSRASAEPGRYRTDQTPYMREIMDALSQGHGITPPPDLEGIFQQPVKVGTGAERAYFVGSSRNRSRAFDYRRVESG